MYDYRVNLEFPRPESTIWLVYLCSTEAVCWGILLIRGDLTGGSGLVTRLTIRSQKSKASRRNTKRRSIEIKTQTGRVSHIHLLIISVPPRSAIRNRNADRPKRRWIIERAFETVIRTTKWTNKDNVFPFSNRNNQDSSLSACSFLSSFFAVFCFFRWHSDTPSIYDKSTQTK